MAVNTERKEYPISMRLPEADIALIDRAAGLRSRSRTDFVREAAVRAAEEVLMENRLIRMSAEGFAEFSAILSGPVAPVPEMVDLVKRPAPWEPGYRTKA
jgi:uncharacterized protein (DUF1778 family)